MHSYKGIVLRKSITHNFYCGFLFYLTTLVTECLTLIGVGMRTFESYQICSHCSHKVYTFNCESRVIVASKGVDSNKETVGPCVSEIKIKMW